MNFLKNFHIQWTWFQNKHEWGVGLLIAFIILILAFLGATVFVLGFLHNNEGERIISSNSIQIIGGISALVFSYLYYILCTYTSLSKNFKIAIDEAWKFAEENYLTYQSDFLYVFNKTKETKNPAIVNEWIEDHKKWQDTVKKMKQLEKDKEELPQRIADTAREIKTLWGKIFS